MTCYRESESCWGSEQVDIVNGSIVSSCAAHLGGRERTPVLAVEIHSGMVDYDEIEDHLNAFIEEEIGSVPGLSMYGLGSPIATGAADLYSWKAGIRKASGSPEPTHLFIAWDFEDEAIFKHIDHMLDRGVVINSVTV